MIDLHTHSTCSDGSLSPSELVQKAKTEGIRFLALTDHDTVAGLQEAEAAAQSAGIHFIPGIEISVTFYNGELHLLGLGLNHYQDIDDHLNELQRRRNERNQEIIIKMQKFGLDINLDEVRSFSGGHTVGRPHFAQALIKRGLVANPNDAFFKYLGKDRPFYVPKENFDFKKAQGMINDCDGVSVLAHPLSLGLNWAELDEYIIQLKDQGLMGIEAYYGMYKSGQCKKLAGFARKNHMVISGGSDFHGDSKPLNRLGFYKNRKIPGKCLSAFL